MLLKFSSHNDSLLSEGENLDSVSNIMDALLIKYPHNPFRAVDKLKKYIIDLTKSGQYLDLEEFCALLCVFKKAMDSIESETYLLQIRQKRDEFADIVIRFNEPSLQLLKDVVVAKLWQKRVDLGVVDNKRFNSTEKLEDLAQQLIVDYFESESIIESMIESLSFSLEEHGSDISFNDIMDLYYDNYVPIFNAIIELFANNDSKINLQGILRETIKEQENIILNNLIDELIEFYQKKDDTKYVINFIEVLNAAYNSEHCYELSYVNLNQYFSKLADDYKLQKKEYEAINIIQALDDFYLRDNLLINYYIKYPEFISYEDIKVLIDNVYILGADESVETANENRFFYEISFLKVKLDSLQRESVSKIEDFIEKAKNYLETEKQRYPEVVKSDLYKNFAKYVESAVAFCNKKNMDLVVGLNSKAVFAEGVVEGMIKKKEAIDKKVGRNEPCPCGSGKKFKKCCGS